MTLESRPSICSYHSLMSSVMYMLTEHRSTDNGRFVPFFKTLILLFLSVSASLSSK